MHGKIEIFIEGNTQNKLITSPNKCQTFGMELQYMGNIIFIKDRTVCVIPLRNKLKAIQKLNTNTIKCCRNFAGIIKFVLSRNIEIIKTNISSDHRGQTIYLGRRKTKYF